MAVADIPVVTPRAAALGLPACIALVVGNMIGSGVFLLPSALAQFGPISIGGWVITSTGAILLALVFGRLARQVPKTGGPYAYTREGFGEFAGFLVAWGYWIALWAGNAAVAVAFAGYVGFLIPAIGHSSLLGLAVALAAIWLLTWINVHGVETAGSVQLVTTVLKLLPLLAIALLGIAYIEPANYAPLNVSDRSAIGAIGACAALTLWAFLGLESATVPAGNVDRPEVTIPRATVIGTTFAAILYVLVTIAVMGLVPLEQLRASSAPLADAAMTIWGAWGGWLVAIGACVSTFGTLNGFTLLTGQVPLGAAQDGLFPRRFGELTRAGTPGFGLVCSNLLASGLVAMNFTRGLVEAFTFIILLATLTTLVPYIFCALAEFMLYLRNPSAYGGRGLGRSGVIAALAFAYSLWAIYGAGADIVYYGFLLLVAGVPVYVGIKWRRAAIPAPAGTQPRG
jgi:basic amino acid/polyamine antiporter, APA family